jgi:hypothetical protein
MLKQPNAERQVQQVEALMQLTDKINLEFSRLHAILTTGAEEFSGAGITLPTCQAAAERYQRIENKISKLLIATVRNHQDATYFLNEGSNEGNKTYP